VTYALSHPLQAAIFQRLAAFPALQALVGPHVYDQVPPGTLPPLLVALGPETARDRSDKTGRGSEHDLQVAVVAEAAGFSSAKAAAAAVSDALIDTALPLARGRLVSLRFLRAQARRREAGDGREITLTFRARVEDA
jgi:hypothetical protein